MMEWAQGFPEWAQANSTLALSVVFAAAFLDCLFVIGLIFISAPFLFGAGVLVAAGAFDFWPTILVIAAGGTAGDTISYLIGRHYGPGLFNRPYLTRRPALLNHGRAFFSRHGGKGLILAHHIGVLRPLLPAVAGAYGLSPLRYTLAVIPGTLMWALVCTVIGMAIGASMGLAAEVTRRLAILIVGTGLTLWLTLWLTWMLARTAQAHAEIWLNGLLRLGRKHRILGKLGPALADPEQPETPVLALFAGALLSLAATSLLLIWGVQAAPPPGADFAVYQTLRNLENPWATQLAAFFSLLGEWPVYLPYALSLLLLLGWFRHRRAAAHWLAALLFGSAITAVLSLIPNISNPLEHAGLVSNAHFPRDLVMAAVIYGLTPVLFFTGAGGRVHTGTYALMLMLLVLLLMARLYLGTLWLSVGVVAVLTGLAWVAALGLGYRLHTPDRIAARHIAPALAVLALAAVWHCQGQFDARVREHTPVTVNRPLELQRWWSSDWTLLRARRQDMAGHDRQYLNLQWAGRLDEIRAALLASGWSESPPAGLPEVLSWLSDDAPVGELPLLPRYHAGHQEVLRLRRVVDHDHQLLLRLWPSDYELDGGLPLWTGTLVQQEAQIVFRVFRYPTSENVFTAALDALQLPLPGFEDQRVTRPHTTYATQLLRPAMSVKP